MNTSFIELVNIRKSRTRILLKGKYEAGANFDAWFADTASHISLLINIMLNIFHVKKVVTSGNGVFKGEQEGLKYVEKKNMFVELEDKLLFVGISAVTEAVDYVKKAGVEAVLIIETIKGGLADSTVMNAQASMMVEVNFRLGFKIDLHLKDLANALSTGHEISAQLPLIVLVQEIMQALCTDDFGQNDYDVGYAKNYAKVS